MILQFSDRVAELPPVWVSAVHLVYCALSFVNVYQSVRVLLSLLVLRAGCRILLYKFMTIAFLFFFYPMPI